ncbi:SPRY domain-containing protein 7-like isoform X2 [Gordionus sp. m RMFG-2023]|uniref:SPRY domain-containing protein 7-like isoform X2 n=1 Tax=Gordionus sp. m RMFG-2023 TaxID=3053472 RepID=UPI0031FBE32D
MLNSFKYCWCKYNEFPKEELLCPVYLDTHFMGDDAIIIKNGQRLCGKGGALCNAPILQDKAYFEFVIQQSGKWSVGLSSRNINLNKTPLGNSENWVLKENGKIYNNNEIKGILPEVPGEGHIYGISYDHVELLFYKNGNQIENLSIKGLKGILYPLFFAPFGYKQIMIEQSLL